MKRNIVIGSTSLLIIIMIIYSFFASNNLEVSADTNDDNTIEEVKKEIIFVEIKGAVELPGVYEVESGVRVYEIFAKAGGLRTDANVDYINQTRVVEDETLIIIMTNAEIEEAISKKELMILEESKIYEEKQKQKTIKGYDNCYAVNGQNGEKISLNNATVEQLMTLSGLGESKANAIIDYRNEIGAFTSIDELMNVSGIGEATFNKIKDSISL